MGFVLNLHRTVGLQNGWMKIKLLLCWFIDVFVEVNDIFNWNTFSAAGNNVRNINLCKKKCFVVLV